MQSKNSEQNILEQEVLEKFYELKFKLSVIKDQIKKSKEKLNDTNLLRELDKSRNFFTDHIINKLEKNINNRQLIKDSDNSITIIDDYIKNIDSIKDEISNKIKDNTYDSQFMRSISSYLNESLSAISPLCLLDSASYNELLRIGKTLTYGGSLTLGGGLASLILCPFLSPILFIGGAVGCVAGAPLMVLGETIDKIKNKTQNIFKRNK